MAGIFVMKVRHSSIGLKIDDQRTYTDIKWHYNDNIPRLSGSIKRLLTGFTRNRNGSESKPTQWLHRKWSLHAVNKLSVIADHCTLHIRGDCKVKGSHLKELFTNVTSLDAKVNRTTNVCLPLLAVFKAAIRPLNRLTSYKNGWAPETQCSGFLVELLFWFYAKHKGCWVLWIGVRLSDFHFVHPVLSNRSAWNEDCVIRLPKDFQYC